VIVWYDARLWTSVLSNGSCAHKLASLLGMYIVLGITFTPTATRYMYIHVSLFFTVAVCVICDNFHSMTMQNVKYIKYDFHPIHVA
jgi:hypothetical protein